ncbi:uncharacterized protein LOC143028810 [Oratosquilla oratoria]|uniref:uncharacterized protein LOC143028810 n=1 Tax=Oratosquilla oratoria TaxID=337810 RepID=UPI003F76BE4C
MGMPHLSVSDNAANFGDTDRFLRELKDHPEIREFFTNHHSFWTFITPLGPWEGGVYERLVGITKSNLRKALPKHTPTYDKLRTLCQELECVMNNHPFIYVSTADDIPLTPNHFMHGRTNALSPQIQLTNSDNPDYLVATTLRTQYQFLTDALQTFKRRWTHDYVTSLKERHLRLTKTHQRVPRVHDLVLLTLDGVPQDQYSLAHIIQVFPGPDNVIRSVRVRTAKGEYERSVTQIIPLELNLSIDTHPPPSPADDSEPPVESPLSEEEVEYDTVDKETTLVAVDPTESASGFEDLISPTPDRPSPTTLTDAPTEPPAIPPATATADTTKLCQPVPDHVERPPNVSEIGSPYSMNSQLS